jgi:hypothetical protein
VAARVEEAGWDTCVVANEQGVVLGRLRRKELDSQPESVVEDVMQIGPSTIRPNDSLEQLRERLAKVGSLIVTTPDGVLLGVLYAEDAERKLER